MPHAGELAGPQSIRLALDLLHAERIGHGVRIIEDEALMAEVRDQGIPLELCPTSNRAMGVIKGLDEHPFPRLLQAGLRVTLNPDVPSIFASPLSGEYEVARAAFGLDDATLAAIAGAGVSASFADPATKATLQREIDLWLG